MWTPKVRQPTGVGSHSCGPVLDKKYQTPDSGEIEFTILFDKE